MKPAFTRGNVSWQSLTRAERGPEEEEGGRKEGGREEGGQASSVRPKAGGGGVWRAAEAEGPGWARTGQQVACDWAEQQHGPRGTTEQPLPNRGFVSEDSDKVAIPGASGQKTQCEPRVPKAQRRYL